MTALERIKELEEQLQDAYVKIDLLQEHSDELEQRNRVLTGQVMNLLRDHRYPDLKVG